MSICAWWSQLTSSEKAAWVQAIGSVLAIIAAFLIPMVQRSLDRREAQKRDRLKARALAAVLRAPLEQWLSSFSYFEDEAHSLDGRSRRPHLVAAAARDNGFFSPPHEVTDKLENLHLLRSAGGLLFDAIRKSHEAKASASMLQEQCPDDQLESTGNRLMDEINRQYMSVKNDISEALSEIVEIL